MNPLTQFLLWCSGTDKIALEALNGSDYADSRNSQAMLGAFVLLTYCFASISGTYALWLITGNFLAALLLGQVFALFIFALDRAVVSMHEKLTVAPRFILAIAIAICVSVPLELRISQEPIQEAIHKEVRHDNQILHDELTERHGLVRVQDRIQELSKLRTDYTRERDRQRVRMEAEETGEIIDGWGSGNPGRGSLYESAEERLFAAQEKIDELELEFIGLEAEEREIHNIINREIRENRINESIGLSKNIAVLQQLKKDDVILRYIGWGLKLIFLLFEITPLLMKLINTSAYAIFKEQDIITKKKEAHKHRIISKAELKVVETEMRGALHDHEDEINRAISEKQDERENNPGSSDLSNARRSYDFVLNNLRNANGQQQPGKHTTNANSKPGSSTQKSRPKAKVNTNGQIPLNPFIIFFAALSAVLLLELFTPVAPVQRVIGASVSLLPPSVFGKVTGINAAMRFSLADSIHASLQNSPEIRTSDGLLIKAGTIPAGLPKLLKEILINTENHRFERIFVIDYYRTFKALLDAVYNKSVPSGTSGITQQVARSIFLGNRERSIVRKIQEFLIAAGLKHRFTKEEILELYAYNVFLGGNVNGFQNASLAYYKKPLEQLSVNEMIALVSILPAPNTYLKNAQAFKKRNELVSSRLMHLQVIEPIDYNKAITITPDFLETPFKSSVSANMRHANSYLKNEFGDREIIHTTLVPKVNNKAREILKSMVFDVQDITGLDDLDGFILFSEQSSLIAMVGSVDPYSLNNTVHTTAWTPGSTLKPLIYAEFLNQGGSLDTPLPVQPRNFDLDGYEQWFVRNASVIPTELKYMSMSDAFAASLNVPVAQIAYTSVSDSLRIRFKDTGLDGYFDQNPASLLGPKSMRPIDLFHVLHAFVPPYGVIPKRIKAIVNQRHGTKRIWDEDVAEKIKYAMKQSIDKQAGTLHETRINLQWSGESHAGKTGTSQNYTSATLFVTKSNGRSLLAGIFSRSGKPMIATNNEYRNITGSSLAPYTDMIFKSLSDTGKQEIYTYHNLEEKK